MNSIYGKIYSKFCFTIYLKIIKIHQDIIFHFSFYISKIYYSTFLHPSKFYTLYYFFIFQNSFFFLHFKNQFSLTLRQNKRKKKKSRVIYLWTNSYSRRSCGDNRCWSCNHGRRDNRSHGCRDRSNRCCSDRSLDRDARVFLNDSIEAVDRIGSIRDHSTGTIWLYQAITTLNHVAVTSFLLRFVVTFKLCKISSLVSSYISSSPFFIYLSILQLVHVVIREEDFIKILVDMKIFNIKKICLPGLVSKHQIVL